MTTPVDDLPQLLSDFITHFGNLETQLQHLEAQVSVFRPIAKKLQLRFQDVTSPAEIISETKFAASRNSQIDNSISKTAVEEWENRPDTTNLADSPEINPEITAIICSTSNQPTKNLIYEAVKYSRHGSKSSLSQIGSLANLATGTRRQSYGGQHLSHSRKLSIKRSVANIAPRRRSDGPRLILDTDANAAFETLMRQKAQLIDSAAVKDTSTGYASSRKGSHATTNHQTISIGSQPSESMESRIKPSGTLKRAAAFRGNELKAVEEVNPTEESNNNQTNVGFINIWKFGLDENSTACVILDFALSLIYLFELWLLPLAIGYDITLPFAMTCISTIKNSIDVVLELITLRSTHPAMQAIKDATIHDWRAHYCKNRMVVDLVTIIPFELIAVHGAEYFWAIRLMRLYKLPSMIHRSPIFAKIRDQMLSFFRIGHSVALILPLTFIFFLFMHLQACVIFLAGRSFEFSNHEISPLKDASLFDQYVWSLYMSTTNIFPLGYHPTNPQEQLITVLFVICGAGLYACIVGAISSIAMGIDASGRLYKQKIDELKEYMQWKSIEPVTQQKVLEYYELKYRGKYFEEGNLLDDMNDSLKMEIAIHNCRELISKVPFLKREENDGRDDLFAGRITSALQPCYYVPGDVVFVQGEIGKDMYFILSGAIIVNISGKGVAVMKAGAFFGEIALVANIPRTATVQAVSSCVLYKLTQEDFNKIVHVFDDIKKKVSNIYKERMERSRVEEESQKLKVAAELIQKVSFLKTDGDEKQRFAEALASVMVPVSFNPEDSVCVQGDVAEDLFIIKTGVLDVYVDGAINGWLRDGDQFGESVLLGGIQIRPYSVKASTVTSCFKVHQESFLRILDSFPELKGRIHSKPMQ